MESHLVNTMVSYLVSNSAISKDHLTVDMKELSLVLLIVSEVVFVLYAHLDSNLDFRMDNYLEKLME
jgi:hypothetical protein